MDTMSFDFKIENSRRKNSNQSKINEKSKNKNVTVKNTIKFKTKKN